MNTGNNELRHLNPYNRRFEIERRLLARMDIAIRYGNLEEIQKMINDPIIQKNLNGISYIVASWGNKQIAEYFFSLPGVDVNGGSDGSCITPLKEAMRTNNMAAFEVLLTHPDININTKFCDGFGGETSLLEYALSGHKDKFLKRLIAHPGIEIDDNALDLFVMRRKVNILLESPVHQSIITRLFVRHPAKRRMLHTGVLAERAFNRRRHALSGWATAQAALAAADVGEAEAVGGAGAAAPARNNATRNNGNEKRNSRRRRNTRRGRKY